MVEILIGWREHMGDTCRQGNQDCCWSGTVFKTKGWAPGVAQLLLRGT